MNNINSNRIIIDPENPGHVLEAALAAEDGGHSILHGSGIRRNNEMSDYVVNKGDAIPLHTHEYGYELFYVVKGVVTAVVGGFRALVEPGDMLLIQPFTPHGFQYNEDTLWWEILSELSMWDDVRSIDRIFENCPDLFFRDRAFNENFMRRKGQTDYLEFPMMDVTEVKPEGLPGFLRKGACYKSYRFPGIECRLKYPKWELNGLKEVWEFALDENVSVDFAEHYFSEEFMVVAEGRVLVEAQREEPQIAEKGHVIRIPDYTAHRITALKGGAVVQDFNVQFNLLLMLDEIDAYRRKDPGSLGKSRIRDIFSKYNCPYTGITGIFGS